MSVEPVARLGQILEDLFTAARDGRGPSAALLCEPLAEAVTFLANVIQVSEEDQTQWLTEHAPTLKELGKRIEDLGRQSAASVPAPPETATATTLSLRLHRRRRRSCPTRLLPLLPPVKGETPRQWFGSLLKV